MIRVGITGGIGSGKTTVCQIFEVLGVPIYYADDRAKKLMTSDKKVKNPIKELLGEEAYFKNGRLNRRFISKKVFNNKKLLKGLNAIVHPAVAKDYVDWCHNLSTQPYTLKEAALLVEAGSYKELEKLIVVTADLDMRIDRVALRDNLDKASILKRIEAQVPEEEKISFADFIIDNSGNESLIKQVLHIHKLIIGLVKND